MRCSYSQKYDGRLTLPAASMMSLALTHGGIGLSSTFWPVRFNVTVVSFALKNEELGGSAPTIASSPNIFFIFSVAFLSPTLLSRSYRGNDSRISSITSRSPLPFEFVLPESEMVYHSVPMRLKCRWWESSQKQDTHVRALLVGSSRSQRPVVESTSRASSPAASDCHCKHSCRL